MSEGAWSERDSEDYRALAAVAVPARAELLAAFARLAPFRRGDRARVVELGAGEGVLAALLLELFPRAHVVALDGSASMRAEARRRLERHGGRAAVEPFDLGERTWRARLDGADLVVSSLAVHHLEGPAKRTLYRDVAARAGALLVADLVEPPTAAAAELHAAAWDRDARARAERAGAPELYERFVSARWNHFRWPDPADRPSGLFEQLTWLAEAGFAVVDCFWASAGHALVGGYRAAPPRDAGVPYEDALAAARRALGEP